MFCFCHELLPDTEGGHVSRTKQEGAVLISDAFLLMRSSIIIVPRLLLLDSTEDVDKSAAKKTGIVIQGEETAERVQRVAAKTTVQRCTSYERGHCSSFFNGAATV